MAEKIWLANPEWIVDYLQRKVDFDESKIDAGLFSDIMNKSENSILSINGDEATIEINGPLSSSGPDMFDYIFGYGGTSYDSINAAIDEIRENGSIKTVYMNFDSPGGEAIPVDGVWQNAYNLRKSGVRVIAVNKYMMASAAYYIASAADEIYATLPTVLTGSIGTVVTTYKKSEYSLRVEIVSQNAPKKRPNVETKAGKQVFQDLVDSLERTFISRIAAGRGISEQKVIDDFGQGGEFIAKDFDSEKPSALKNGMIDKILNEVEPSSTEHEMELTDESKTRSEAGENIMEETMSLKDLLAQNPAAKIEYDEEKAAHKAELQKQFDAGVESMKKIMNTCSTYVGNENYKGIESQVQKVLKGESEVSSLEGAVAAFDMIQAQSRQSDAQDETADVGETTPETPESQSEDGMINSIEDILAAAKGGIQ